MSMSPEERMKVWLRREEVEATGKPFYTEYEDIPKGLFSRTQCTEMKQPIFQGEEPMAYVLNRNWNGYLLLYKRNAIQ